MPSILHASLSPHLRPHLQSAVSRDPVPSTSSSSSSSSSGSLGFSSGFGFWSSSFGSLFLGLFLNHFGFSLIFWVFRVSLSLRLFEFQPLSPSVLCSPSIVLLLFFYTYSVLYSLFICDCDLNFMPKFTYLTF